jgi:tetratricopeptide (TPR) repeat protein
MPVPPTRSPYVRFLPRATALLAAAWMSACGGSTPGQRVAKNGTDLYNQARYSEALPLLAQAASGPARDGTILYQLGFCRMLAENRNDERQKLWEEAEPLLEKEIAAPKGATLERLYYLVVIESSGKAFDKMTQYARQGVEQFEKGPDARSLAGDDWFRLGRMHDFLGETSAAEAAYRFAVSAYSKSPQANPAYHALALIRVADLNYDAERYVEAAGLYDQALKLQPATTQIKPYRHGVALLAAGRFDEAAARFGADRDEETMTEAQYGADLARKAKEVAPLAEKDADGGPITGMLEATLAGRIRVAARDLRAARVKNSMKPGDLLPAEVADAQRRFVTLLRELLLRKKEIQDFCLTENIADLVRR